MRTTGVSLLLVAGLLGAALFPVAGLLAAAPQQTTVQAIAELASDLSQADAPSALSHFDKAIPHYGEISADLVALAAQTDISCAIEIVSDEEANGVHKLDLDWIISLKAQGSETVERRRERVQAEMRLLKGKWRITAFTPLTVLEPIHVR